MPPTLPQELLIQIFSCIAPQRSNTDSAVRDLVNCGLVSSAFKQAAFLPSIWESHYRQRYTHSDHQRDPASLSHSQQEWARLYRERRRADNMALSLLHKVIYDRRNRYHNAHQLLRMGFDIWDCLDMESRHPVPAIFQGSSGDVPTEAVLTPSTRHALTSAFWARTLLEYISRIFAIKLWVQVSDPDTREVIPFVEAYSALSCFAGYTPHQIARLLQDLAAGCRTYISQKGYAWNVRHPENAANIICEYMTSVGFGPAAAGQFHDLSNQYPHLYLTTNRRSIPISLSHAFVAIARALGLEASPVAFPNRVIVHIAHPDPEQENTYVDVYSCQLLSVKDDIPQMLLQAGVSPDHADEFIRPCGAYPMILRCARNIINSLHDFLGVIPPSRVPSALLSVIVHVLFVRQQQLASYLVSTADILDCATYILHEMVPALYNSPALQDSLRAICKTTLAREEEEASKVRLRSTQECTIQFFVGMIFEHIKYHYSACIIGWDPTCDADEAWIVSMQVDRLSRGRHQPFYSVLSVEDGSQRYVAEENILAIAGVPDDTIRHFMQQIPKLPLWFTNTEVQPKSGLHARFLLGPDLEHGYPEDEHVGAAWVRKVAQEGQVEAVAPMNK